MVIVKSVAELSNTSKAKMHRIFGYFGITVWLYLLALCAIWIDVRLGGVSSRMALYLTGLIVSGALSIYVLILLIPRQNLTMARLATLQGIHGIVCIALSYAVLGPLRPLALMPLPLILLLCSFSVSANALYGLGAFSVVALGASMICLTSANPSTYEVVLETMYLIATASVLGVVLYLIAQFNALRRRLSLQKAELAVALASVQSLAFRDELTKLPNRRFMNDLLLVEERRQTEEKNTLCVALLDIDYFKQINDKYGHLAGDKTLSEFADLLNGALRTGDVLARWGGEEFLLLLPDTDADTGLAVLKRLQLTLEERNKNVGDTGSTVTFSAGLAVVNPGQSIPKAVHHADKAMFQAKAAGRNTIRQYMGASELSAQ